jgi:hypothetical protein
MQRPAPTPPRIVDADGRVHVGWFDRPFEDANLQDAPSAHLLGGLRGTPLSLLERGFRRMRLKQWHYTSVATPQIFFACAVVDAGYAGNAFAYVVERASGRCFEWSTLAPLSRGVVIANNSTDGRTAIEQPGWGRITLDNDGARGVRSIDVRLEGRLGKSPLPPLRAQFTIDDAGSDPDPIVVVEESAPRHWLYTHKCYGLKARGELRCGELVVDVEDGHAGLDFNRGYRPRQTWWNWAAAGGHASNGSRVGFNLTAHRPWRGSGHEVDGSDHDAADCALWLGGRCVKIARVEFDYDPANLMTPWQIRDGEGLVELRFSPAGERSEDINFGLVVSQFHQPYGTFEGELRDRDGNRFALRDVFGVTEQHFAKW